MGELARIISQSEQELPPRGLVDPRPSNRIAMLRVLVASLFGVIKGMLFFFTETHYYQKYIVNTFGIAFCVSNVHSSILYDPAKERESFIRLYSVIAPENALYPNVKGRR